jgi:hypothetical protein
MSICPFGKELNMSLDGELISGSLHTPIMTFLSYRKLAYSQTLLNLLIYAVDLPKIITPFLKFESNILLGRFLEAGHPKEGRGTIQAACQLPSCRI